MTDLILKCKCRNSIILTVYYAFRFKNETENNYQVTAINMFKTNIVPQWEDPKNEKGGEFRIEISGRDPTMLQKVWETLA